MIVLPSPQSQNRVQTKSWSCFYPADKDGTSQMFQNPWSCPARAVHGSLLYISSSAVWEGMCIMLNTENHQGTKTGEPSMLLNLSKTQNLSCITWQMHHNIFITSPIWGFPSSLCSKKYIFNLLNLYYTILPHKLKQYDLWGQHGHTKKSVSVFYLFITLFELKWHQIQNKQRPNDMNKLCASLSTS